MITGGAGFLGCALAEALARTGDRVVVLDILHPQVHAGRGRPKRLADSAELLPLDITSSVNWDAVLKLVQPDTVVHLAAETGTGQSLQEATRHATVNVVGTAQMLDAFLRHDSTPGHILLASSRAVYGEGLWRTEDGRVFSPGPRRHADLMASKWDPGDFPTGMVSPVPNRMDTTPARPTSVYGATKAAQEMVCSAWAAATDTPLSILRLQNVYGPGQSLTNAYTGIVAMFSRTAKQGETIDVYEDGNITRDFVHVDDVISAMAAALGPPVPGERVLDIGSGESTTIATLAKLVASHYDAPEPLVSGHFRDGDVRAAFADIGPAKEQLGYRPIWSLLEGLDSLFSWIDEELRQ
ncbi:MAG TPA: SDR family NAD(P)-dependent oxidoreductase [Acidimicrobiales bacterium]|nr:SDR family NAD(P)-dependent oxidoreductase [Acidimicrobiales bacterium]